jgi:hypothetical protein
MGSDDGDEGATGRCLDGVGRQCGLGRIVRLIGAFATAPRRAAESSTDGARPAPRRVDRPRSAAHARRRECGARSAGADVRYPDPARPPAASDPHDVAHLQAALHQPAVWACCVVGYLLGSIPFGLVFAK